MSIVTFYEKPGCATNARQQQLLRTAGHQVVARNLLTEPWTAVRLREFFAALPIESWFNRAAPRIKSGEIDPTQLTPEAALGLMLAEPLLIKRPLIEIADIRFVGFDPKRLQAANVLPERDPNRDMDRDMEACSHRGLEPKCPNSADHVD